MVDGRLGLRVGVLEVERQVVLGQQHGRLGVASVGRGIALAAVDQALEGLARLGDVIESKPAQLSRGHKLGAERSGVRRGLG